MLVIVSVVRLLFARVAVKGALVLPMFVVGNVSFVGVTETPLTPLPLSEIVCGLFVALSLIVTSPVTVPLAVGLNVTEIVHFLPAKTVLPQLLV